MWIQKFTAMNHKSVPLSPKVDRLLKDATHLRRVCDLYSKFYGHPPLFERIYDIAHMIIHSFGYIEHSSRLYGRDPAGMQRLTSTLDHCVLRVAQLKQIFLQMPDSWLLSTRQKKDHMKREMEALANSLVAFKRIYFLLDEIDALVMAFEKVNRPVILSGLGISVPAYLVR
ncbi:hypothetical protein DTO045G8_7939 [Paecilomyces variotii]|nr:hypothetical protein DTO045G8_7939 [Paecilomyces variotii]